ncbi:MAG TPA: hypothetical protein VFP65_06150 [Anaeromyxobacteraceae bacterium]|nr:hypothetical protein [Anaeromyxobacteraceae bacterium]
MRSDGCDDGIFGTDNRGSTTAAQPPAPSYAPAYTPEPHQAAHARAEPRGQFGLVLMPGGTTFDRGHTTAMTGAVGIELRGDSGGFRLRVAFEYAHDVRVADATLKFDLNDGGLFCPFLALVRLRLRLHAQARAQVRSPCPPARRICPSVAILEVPRPRRRDG